MITGKRPVAFRERRHGTGTTGTGSGCRHAAFDPETCPSAGTGLGHEWRGNTEIYSLTAIHRGEAPRLQDGLGFIEQEF